MVEPALNILDIAAGTGALSAGIVDALAQLGIHAKTVCGIEREATAAAAFVARVENETGRRPAVWDDANTFVSRRYRRPGTGSGIDIICGGYPCQPFSQAGRRLGSKDDRHLWPACRRIVARFKPGLVFFENVSGHVSLGLDKVLKDLERLGYRTAVGLFTAQEVRAPHQRLRVFIFGISNSEWSNWQPWARRERVCQTGGSMGDDTSQRRRNRKEGRRANGHAIAGASDALGELGDGKSISQREPFGIECTNTRQNSRDASRCTSSTICERDSTKPGELAHGQCEGPQGDQPTLCKPGDAGSTSECGGEMGNAFDRWLAGGPRPLFPPPRRIDLAEIAKALAKAEPGRSQESIVRPALYSTIRMYRDWEIVAHLEPTLMPSIESGVSVVADGMASSADILRLGGNGVVTMQASVAFLHLLAGISETTHD